jgi:LCP family protein required for cell wall assembly
VGYAGNFVLPTSAPIISGSAVISASLPQPTPMPRIAQPSGTINILLLGSDRRSGESVARTDVLMIASVFPGDASVSLISIPRDYYAWIPTWGLDKINTAYLRGVKTQYPGGGPALIKATIEYNFGLPIHYYALVDFNSYRTLVDAVGGVDIVVECPFHDTYPDPESEMGQTDIDLDPGIRHLDGKFALWYVRSRWNTSDFDRHRRQQQVLTAVASRVLEQNLIPQIPDLWTVYRESVETDLGLPEMLYLGTVAARFDMANLKSRYVRGTTLVQSTISPTGAYILVPQYDALYGFMVEAAQPPVTTRAEQPAFRVEVLNGMGNSSFADVAAYRLALEGFEVVSVSETEGTQRTTIVDLTTTSKGSPVATLLRLYRRNQSDVVREPTVGREADFRVILGWDYDPCVATGTAYWSTSQAVPTPSPTPVQ